MKRTMMMCSMLVSGALAAASTGCLDTARADGDVTAQRTDLEGRLQTVEDNAAIRGVIDCYGHGHDTIFFHLGGDQREALGILRHCFTDDVATQIVFFDGTQPAVKLSSLAELVGFVEQFAISSHYRSARNTPGDVQISRTGPDRARILSSTVAPHYLRKVGDDPATPVSVDLISARYVNDVVRGRDGVWRTQAFTLSLDELWRATGAYPLPR